MAEKLERAADVVIIGGGVMGTSIALSLAHGKAGRIVLCERKFIASGPTGRSSGLLRRHYTLELYARMATDSLEAYKHFEALTGTPADITWVGMLSLVGSEDFDAMKTTVKMLRRIGADAEALDVQGLRSLVPHLNSDGLAGAAYDPTTGYADPAGVAAAYARRARELGVRIHQMTTATSLMLRRGKIAGVKTDQGTVESPTVVNAAGVWAAGIAKTAGVTLSVTPCRVQVVTFRVPVDFPRPRPIFGDNVKRCYVRPEGEDVLMVGTRSQPGLLETVDPDTLNEKVDHNRVLAASEILYHRFPALEQAQALGGYASMYDMTPDGHFILEAAPQVPGLYTAAGFSGHGFKHSPVIGRIMADLILHGKTTQYDITPFSSNRFTDGRPPWRGLYRDSPF